MLAGSVLVFAAVYAAGITRLWRTAGWGCGIRPIQVAGLGAGVLALLAAFSPILHEWTERWQFAHMIQHELLMVVAAPLLAVGGPLVALLWALPAAARQPLVVAARYTRLPALVTLVASPASAFFLYGLALWFWHVPALYNAAFRNESIHLIQHLCFFGTSVLFWWSLAHGRQGRAGYGAAAVYVFATAVHGGLLGALLTVAPRVWYAPYLVPQADGWLSPLEDQQMAGLLMWVPASVAFAAGGLMLFAGWLAHADRLSRLPARPPAAPRS